MSTGLISTAALLLDISLADLMGCQYSGVDPRKMIDEYHLEIALSGRKKLGYGPYTKFSSSSAPELELTEQQEEFIKLSKNLSEAQIERILAYAQAIYDLQRNKQPSTVLDREGRRIDYSISAPVSKVAEESIGYNCNDPDEGHNREGYQRKGLLKERAKGTEILEP